MLNTLFTTWHGLLVLAAAVWIGMMVIAGHGNVPFLHNGNVPQWAQ